MLDNILARKLIHSTNFCTGPSVRQLIMSIQQSPLEKLTVSQLVKKSAAFYGTRMFITVFSRSRHWSLSWARWIQSTPSLRSIRILPPIYS